jgi:acetolactate synthase I/II/III large subunit
VPKQDTTSFGGFERAFLSEPAAMAQRALAEVSRSDGATLSNGLVGALYELGCRQAFGQIGGGIGVLYDALASGGLDLMHCTSEAVAGYATCEASILSGQPTCCFATTGPAVWNLMASAGAARAEGGRVVYVTGLTNPADKGRAGTQETSEYTMLDGLYRAGSVFHFGKRIESVKDLPDALRNLALGFSRPDGFVAHLGITAEAQATLTHRLEVPAISLAVPAPTQRAVTEVVRAIVRGKLMVMVGWGARNYSRLVRHFVERTGIPAFTTVRAKGVLPGRKYPCVGLGAGDAVERYLREHRPESLLVLGSQMSDPSMCLDRSLLPRQLFQVDVRSEAFGLNAPPGAEILGIPADVGEFLRLLLESLPPLATPPSKIPPIPLRLPELSYLPHLGVHPAPLFAAIQELVLDRSDAPLLVEAGKAFAWAGGLLAVAEPHRFRVSVRDGALGHMGCGVVGAASTRRAKAVALVGDGSFHSANGLATAIKYKLPVLYVVIDDGGYVSCIEGQQGRGLSGEHLELPELDFVGQFSAFRRSERDRARTFAATVESDEEIHAALRAGMRADGPALIHVKLCKDAPSLLGARYRQLDAASV